jgi:hypothetical protein
MLSAHTIASFMHLQHKRNFDDLMTAQAMPTTRLHELLRSRAFDWWHNDNGTERLGEPPWLVTDSDGTRLTEAGLEKVHRRAHGEERTSNGRRSGYNVSLNDIRLALDLIENGPSSTLGKKIALAPIP